MNTYTIKTSDYYYVATIEAANDREALDIAWSMTAEEACNYSADEYDSVLRVYIVIPAPSEEYEDEQEYVGEVEYDWEA